MKKNHKKPVFEEWLLSELKQFPLQRDFFREPSDEEIGALAEDILVNGLKCRIEILPANAAGYPAGTILAGHSRLKALRSLGRTKTRVRVKHELAKATAAEIQRYVIDDNLHRRQLSKLDRLRVALRLCEIERDRTPGQLLACEQHRARDRVAEVVGMSGRNLDRHLRVLKTPIAVQTAFDNGDLSLVNADKVASLPPDIQERIAEKITGGEKAKKVVANYLSVTAKNKGRRSAVSEFVRAVKRANKSLEGHSLKGYTARARDDEVEALQQCRESIDRILAAYEEGEQKFNLALQEAARKVQRRSA